VHFAHRAARAQALCAQANHASASQLATEDVSRLNLDSTGAPLRFQVAIRGKDEDKWHEAEIDELMRLSPEQSRTLYPVHMAAVPSDRRGDITYYNPKPKEKLDGDSDKINYPGDASARVADLDAVKMHLQSRSTAITSTARWRSPAQATCRRWSTASAPQVLPRAPHP
jgi:hypothetical protein